MARQTKRQAQKQTEQATLYRCRDCANSYDWHSKETDEASNALSLPRLRQ